MGNNQEVFDGLEVSVYDGKFAGSFDLDDLTARGISLDDEITFLVSGHVKAANISETRDGHIKRTNTFTILSAQALSSAKAAQIRTSMSQFSQQLPDVNQTGYAVLDDPRPEWATAPTASLFADEEEDVYDEIATPVPEEEDDIDLLSAPWEPMLYEEDDIEVIGEPIAYKDPVLAKMMELP